MNVISAIVSLTSLFINLIAQSLLNLLVPRRFRRKKDLAGQTVLITGAGSGLGRHLAIEFSKHRACLVLLDIDRPSLLATEKLLDRRSTVFLYECDVADRKRVYEVAEAVRKDAGHVDVLVNNAGVVNGRSLLDIPDEKIVRTFEVNTLAHFWACKAFLPSMVARNKGHLVFVASVAGTQGGPKLSDYCASKSAVVGLVESLELELQLQRLDGVKVTLALPGFIDTGLFEGFEASIFPPLTPERVAKEIVYGVLTDADTVIVPSYINLFVMVKNIFPRWFWNRLFELSGDIRAMENFRGRSMCDDSALKDATPNGN